ncbi:hypothetical protein NFI96_007767 [Prochilodus magdalenae]|nr:hypothetical protein NFI96_007767 [Prochilodus magdalenae]
MGLKENTMYQFRVCAVNQAGAGRPSKPTRPILTSDPMEPSRTMVVKVDSGREIVITKDQLESQIRVPFPPTDVRVCELSDTYAVISWTEPDPRGKEPLTYFVERNQQPVSERTGVEPTDWCRTNNLSLNKTKEMVVDFRRTRRDHSPLHIHGSTVVVKSTKFLGVHLAGDLTWSLNTSTITRKAQQRLYFLRRLRKAHLPPPILTTFYRGTIESILSSCITAWFGNCTASDRKSPQQVVRTAEKIIGVSLPTITDIYTTRCIRKANSISVAGKESWHLASMDMTVSSTRFAAFDLQKGTAYCFRIRSINKYGISDPSEPSQPITLGEPLGVPTAPHCVQAIPDMDSSVLLLWEEPKHMEGILGYYLYCSEVGKSDWRTINNKPVSGTRFTVHGLRTNKDYVFRVKSVGRAGNSRYSEESRPVRVKAAKGPPQDHHRAGVMQEVAHSQHCSESDVVLVLDTSVSLLD